MTTETINKLEERLSILEFKLELALKLSKTEVNLTLEDSKTMTELAYVLNLKKDDFIALNELLTTQIKFYQTFKQKSYISPRQQPKLDPSIDVFIALSKEEYEQAIWECIPKYTDDQVICEKIAKINDIYEVYYGPLAAEIKKTKFNRLDKEMKLLTSYKENKAAIDTLYKEIDTMNDELQANLKHVDEIIEFFHKNELTKITNFYNGELWDKNNNDKKVVISDDSYIHNVCKTDHKTVLDKINAVLTDQTCPYRDIMNHLLTSTKFIDDLNTLYRSMEKYNKNEYVLLTELNQFKENLDVNMVNVDEVMSIYHDYIDTV